MGFLSRARSRLARFYENVRTRLTPKERKEIEQVKKDLAKVREPPVPVAPIPPPKPPVPTAPPVPTGTLEIGSTVEERPSVTLPEEEIYELEIEYMARYGEGREQYYRLPQHYRIRYAVDFEEEHEIVKVQSLDRIRQMNRGTWNERFTLRRV